MGIESALRAQRNCGKAKFIIAIYVFRTIVFGNTGYSLIEG